MNSSLFVLHSSLTNMTEKQQKNAAAAFVFIGNKSSSRIYPNESRSSYNSIELNANVFLPKDENMYQWDS